MILKEYSNLIYFFSTVAYNRDLSVIETNLASGDSVKNITLRPFMASSITIKLVDAADKKWVFF